MLDGCGVAASCLPLTVGNIFKIKGLSVSAATVFFFVFSGGRNIGVFPAFSPNLIKCLYK